MADEWLVKLKAAFDAGYYRTESDELQQEFFPWQSKLCRDCPFWVQDICQVDLTRCSGYDQPCLYFDPPDYPAGRDAIQKRLEHVWRERWHRDQ